MSLEARIVLRQRSVDLAVQVPTGMTLAVVGPNGAGKSTLLAALAGLLRPDEGHITLAGRTLAGTSDTGDAVWVPPHRRRVALVGQSPRLFPHLTVLDNVAFGLRAGGAGRRAARGEALEWLQEFGIQDLRSRRPDQLSGGQTARVALARALIVRPEVMLLDEPLAAVDVDARVDLRALLATATAGMTTILVTHDVTDALVMADRIAVLDSGRVVEHGQLEEVLTRPTSQFGARLAGVNLVTGTLRATGLLTAGGVTLTGRRSGGADGGPGVGVFPPGAVTVTCDPPKSPDAGVFRLVVSSVEPAGGNIRLRAGDQHVALEADLTPAAVVELRAPERLRGWAGRVVWFSVDPQQVLIHPG